MAKTLKKQEQQGEKNRNENKQRPSEKRGSKVSQRKPMKKEEQEDASDRESAAVNTEE